MNLLRRLLIDDDMNGEVIFTFDGDAAGQKAAMKAFEGEQNFSAQTYIAIAPDGMDPCELRQEKGDVAVRDLVARRTPLIEFAVRTQLKEYDLDSVDGQVEALRKTVPLVAQIKDRAKRDGYATKLAWWVGWNDEAAVVRRVRETAGGGVAPARQRRAAPVVDPYQGALAVDVPSPSRPDPRDPRLWHQREALKAALQVPELAGPYYDGLPDDVFTHPSYLALHHAIRGAGGASCGLSGPAFVEAVSQACEHEATRSVLTELAVEPLECKADDEFRHVSAVLARLQQILVFGQISEIKSKLHRISPVQDPDEYRALFGDLVALEEYHKALGQQAVGGL
jgi:DNA primase